MGAHFHVWVRSGRVFTMRPKVYNTQPAAFKAAVKLRPDAVDRMVRACETCPSTRPSKRRPPRWSVVARAVAERFDLRPTAVREVLTEALEAERARI